MFVLTLIILSCISVNEARENIRSLNVMDFLQPEDTDHLCYLPLANQTHHCARQCVKGDNRICYYRMVHENYAVLSAACKDCPYKMEDCFLPQCVTADGFEKGIVTVNRRLPGPAIHVCHGDWIVVDVDNRMPGKTTSVHWHGIYNMHTPYMDGVPFISHCPIPHDSQFRYQFRADHVGTNYWHSHAGLSKLNGIQGSLIVREPLDIDPSSKLYDYDIPCHTIFISDWTHVDAEERLPGLRHGDISHDTTFYTINGQGKYRDYNGVLSSTPQKIFDVHKGYRYRFRLIGGVCTQCPARFQIEGHRLIVIATDGYSVKPVVVDAIEFFSGERYDFVLHATREVSNYWMQVRGMDKCFDRDVCQMAILHYEGADLNVPHSPRPSVFNYKFSGVVLNPLNAACQQGEGGICVTQLQSAIPMQKEIYTYKPDLNLELRYGFYKPTRKEEFYSDTYDSFIQIGPNLTMRAMINNIQLLTPSSPLTSQIEDIPEDTFCPNGTDGMPVCPENSPGICTCLSLVYIPKGAVVQMVLIDTYKGSLSHPFHLHGHGFNVISAGYLPPELMNAKDIDGLLRTRKLQFPKSPVMKDTLAVPALGYAVIRFIANNPGFWYFHCHFMYHHAIGMGVILQVGDTKDHPKLPKGLPKCGNYLPPVNVK
ncbi:uncharacterized protein [Periplaneta americana]|uniref:uncharacterized protein n=1 Tax=Periplaneta americana TaxID=6978 RepID=UPI0037E8CBFE